MFANECVMQYIIYKNTVGVLYKEKGIGILNSCGKRRNYIKDKGKEGSALFTTVFVGGCRGFCINTIYGKQGL